MRSRKTTTELLEFLAKTKPPVGEELAGVRISRKVKFDNDETGYKTKSSRITNGDLLLWGEDNI